MVQRGITLGGHCSWPLGRQMVAPEVRSLPTLTEGFPLG